MYSALIAMGVYLGNPRRRQVSLTHTQDNQLLLRKTHSKENISLIDLCKTTTPSTCNLNHFLFNGHMQTIRTVFETRDVPIYYKRKIFESDNPALGGQFSVDFVVDAYQVPEEDAEEVTDAARKFTLPSGLPPRTTLFTADELSALPSSTDTTPMLVILHGLTGGSHEPYLRCVVEALRLRKGWEACVVNSRGCAQTRISSGVLYNARATWDVRQVLKWLRDVAFPNRPLFGLGYSLGANILANVCQHIIISPRIVDDRN